MPETGVVGDRAPDLDAIRKSLAAAKRKPGGPKKKPPKKMCKMGMTIRAPKSPKKK